MQKIFIICLSCILSSAYTQVNEPCKITDIECTIDTAKNIITINGYTDAPSTSFIWVFCYSSNNTFIKREPTTATKEGSWIITTGWEENMKKLIILIVDANTNRRIINMPDHVQMPLPMSLCNKEIYLP
jgi:carotenoid cleavage dioxygenase-like enzyme